MPGLFYLRNMKTYIYCLVVNLLMAVSAFNVQAAEIRLAAAANLRYALTELTHTFEQQTEHRIQVSYAASGTLTTQIEHGAPFDLFLSANPDYVQRLIKQGYGDEATEIAGAQMVLFAGSHSSVTLDEQLSGLKKALMNGTLNKVAIANPRHAPYGQAAKQLLEQAELWQPIQTHLLIAENASQVVQFSLSTSVDIGFVPYSYIIQPQLIDKGRFIKLKASLPQHALAINSNNSTVGEFMLFLQSAQAKKTFEHHGFLVP